MSNWFVRVDTPTSIYAVDAEKKRDAVEIQGAIKVRLADLVHDFNVVLVEEAE